MYLKLLWNVFEMYLKCLWNVFEMSLKCLWNVFGLSLICIWNVFELLLKCLWNVVEISLKCLWIVFDMSLTCLLNVFDISLTCLWTVFDMSLKCLWNVCGKSLICLWYVFEMSLRCLWGICEMSLKCLWNAFGMSPDHPPDQPPDHPPDQVIAWSPAQTASDHPPDQSPDRPPDQAHFCAHLISFCSDDFTWSGDRLYLIRQTPFPDQAYAFTWSPTWSPTWSAHLGRFWASRHCNTERNTTIDNSERTCSIIRLDIRSMRFRSETNRRCMSKSSSKLLSFPFKKSSKCNSKIISIQTWACQKEQQTHCFTRGTCPTHGLTLSATYRKPTFFSSSLYATYHKVQTRVH